jgi:hypothetical protein
MYTIVTIVQVFQELCQVPSSWILTFLAELVAEVLAVLFFRGPARNFLLIYMF